MKQRVELTRPIQQSDKMDLLISGPRRCLLLGVMSLLLLGSIRCDKILSAGDQCGGPGIDGECEAGLVCVAESLESEIAFCEGTYWYLKFSNVITYAR